MRTSLIFILGWIFLCSSAFGQTLFQERNGLVVIEIESHVPTGNWKGERTMKGFTGLGYYTWCGPNRFNAPGSGVLAYQFLVTDPGKYNLFIRNRHDFKDSTLENDCFTRLDGGKWVKTFSSKRGEWTWGTRHEHSHDKKIQAAYDLTPGVHRIEISGRSANFSIDRIHLAKEKHPRANDSSISQTMGIPMPPDMSKIRDVGTSWSQGKLGMALAKARKRTSSTNVEAAEQATKATRVLEQYADDELKKIEGRKADSPLVALNLLAILAQQYKGDTKGKALLDKLSQWKKEPELAKEIAAMKLLSPLRNVGAPLVGRGKASQADFYKANRRVLHYIQNGVKKIKKEYPDTIAAKEGQRLADELGIPLTDE